MKKIILAQVLTAKGKTEFSGLYDRHGNAVTVEVERDSSGVSLIVWQDEQKKQHFDCGISEEEMEKFMSVSKKIYSNLQEKRNE